MSTPVVAGDVFHRLTVLGFYGRNKHRQFQWACLCSCGNKTISISADLLGGHVKSCGCLSKELKSERALTHGMSKTSIYGIWASLIGRCKRVTHKQYSEYGGRGITVCERWLEFDNFYFDMGERPSKKHSIDRIDNDGPYSPENCRWATKVEQANNTRGNRVLLIDGESKTMAEWARVSGVPYKSLFARISRGEGIDRRLLRPIRTTVVNV